MNDTTPHSEQILRAAKQSLAEQQGGGVHRRARSIGQGSAKLKRDSLLKKFRNVALAVFAIWVGAGVFSAVVGPLLFWGFMATVVATVVAVGVLGVFPKVKVPKRADINKGDVRQMVARTELWLEHQRTALPAPAVKLVEDMGVQLDALGLQLEKVPANHEAMHEIRQLIGETLPEMIDSYRAIPAHLRAEQRAGATPDEQLVAGLGKISREIDSVTRQLAQGSLDDLAIKHRYLDYKYGEGIDQGSGVPLPDFSLDQQKTAG
jgi:hypothetical protein